MLFGLTNVPSTFQTLMHEVFRIYLRKFVLVFFDEILIYSQSLDKHLRYLRLVFLPLHQHQLRLKECFCTIRSGISWTYHFWCSSWCTEGWNNATMPKAEHNPGAAGIFGVNQLLPEICLELWCYWWAHFWGWQFTIKTDCYSLKFLLEQRITTSLQQQWIASCWFWLPCWISPWLWK